MRLFMTADAVGGVWTYALDLARGLVPHGVETTLAVNGPGLSEARRAEAASAGVALIDTGLPLDWLAETPGEVEAAGRALGDLAEAHRADLVQLNSPAYAAGAGFSRPVVGVQHSCTATWWAAVKGEEPWPDDFGWRYDLARRGLLACDRVVAPTAAFAVETARAYALETLPMAVWNGRAPLDASAPEAGGGAGVLTAGRLWDESKGLGVLDAAAVEVVALVQAAGPLVAPWGGEARFRHLEALGPLAPDRLAQALGSAAVFVSPSLYEPFGLAALEAAQLGRPLVLADIATFRELWDGAAVFVPPRDPVALAAALNALLADPDRRAELGAAAQARASRYTVEAMAAGMARVFDSLLAQDQLQS